MCGYLFHHRGRNGSLGRDLAAGLASMAHRGPDNESVLSDGDVFMGHRRLKIIDLSVEANQPMLSADGRYAIVFNGEIYNYQEKRALLSEHGIGLRTRSDTEVLLYLYIVFGEACLEHLNGMFSFVIYDRRERSAFGARDHMGIKPLYYTQADGELSVASEAGALVAAGLAEGRIDPAAVRSYLIYGSVHAPRTIYRDIFSLRPGHFFTWRAGRMRLQRYWRAPFMPEREKRPVGEAEARGHIRELLESSIRMQMVSDVPLGAFLSGGIDSSAVVGLSAAVCSGPLRTFTIGYDAGGHGHNELPYARRVAERYRTEAREYILDERQVADELEHFLARLDQPSADALNTYFVSKFAREHVTVCLSGLGGDEIFAGYPVHRWLLTLARWRGASRCVPAALGRLLRGHYEQSPYGRRRHKAYRALHACLNAWPNYLDQYRMVRCYLNEAERCALMGEWDGADGPDADEELNGAFLQSLGPIDAACYLDQNLYLPNTLLRDVDVMSMAHSLELRVPILDYRLVEYVAGLPQAVKFRENHPKYMLTSTLRDVLPDEVVFRRKTGFTFPLGYWMRRPPLREILHETLTARDTELGGLMDPAQLRRLLAGYFAEYEHNMDAFRILWQLAILELWLRKSRVAHPAEELC